MQLNEVMNAIEKALDDEREEVSASVWISIEKRVQEALRAQADARPIYQLRRADGAWIDQTEQSYKNNQQHCASDTRIVYTHPKASAPGLSKEQASEAYKLLAELIAGKGLPSQLDCVSMEIHDWLCVPVSKLTDIIRSARAQPHSADAPGLSEQERDALIVAIRCMRQISLNSGSYFTSRIALLESILTRASAATQPNEADK